MCPERPRPKASSIWRQGLNQLAKALSTSVAECRAASRQSPISLPSLGRNFRCYQRRWRDIWPPNTDTLATFLAQIASSFSSDGRHWTSFRPYTSDFKEILWNCDLG